MSDTPETDSHVMVDLETMGNGGRSAIISIGAIPFNKDKILDPYHFYSEVSLESCVRKGMEMDASTILWWLQQSDAAREAFRDNEKASYLTDVLEDFSAWLGGFEDVKIWGCGATFDNTILAAAYRVCDLPRPWSYRNDRCYRTIRELYPDVPVRRQGELHNALDDARTQAQHLIDICAAKAIILR